MSEKEKITFSKLETSKPIPKNKKVRMTEMGHIIEVLSLQREPRALLDYVKIDKYRYMHTGTGEIFDYVINENRSQNIGSVKKTLRKIRQIINNNFGGAKNELMITLTYGVTMTDRERLYKDFEKFIKKLRRKINIEYFSVVEPQGSGSWHCHVLIKDTTTENLYIHNDEVYKMWGHGWTTTRRLKEVDNVGAYLGGYMADMEVCEENKDALINAIILNNEPMKIEEKEVEQNGKKVKKKFAKGARLPMYPSGMNFYRKSRGIEIPETIEMDYGEVKKIVGSATPNYSRTIELHQGEKSINSITYEQYNLKRRKIKE